MYIRAALKKHGHLSIITIWRQNKELETLPQHWEALSSSAVVKTTSTKMTKKTSVYQDSDKAKALRGWDQAQIKSHTLKSNVDHTNHSHWNTHRRQMKISLQSSIVLPKYMCGMRNVLVRIKNRGEFPVWWCTFCYEQTNTNKMELESAGNVTRPSKKYGQFQEETETFEKWYWDRSWFQGQTWILQHYSAVRWIVAREEYMGLNFTRHFGEPKPICLKCAVNQLSFCLLCVEPKMEQAKAMMLRLGKHLNRLNKTNTDTFGS